MKASVNELTVGDIININCGRWGDGWFWYPREPNFQECEILGITRSFDLSGSTKICVEVKTPSGRRFSAFIEQENDGLKIAALIAKGLSLRVKSVIRDVNQTVYCWPEPNPNIPFPGDQL